MFQVIGNPAPHWLLCGCLTFSGLFPLWLPGAFLVTRRLSGHLLPFWLFDVIPPTWRPHGRLAISRQLGALLVIARTIGGLLYARRPPGYLLPLRISSVLLSLDALLTTRRSPRS